MFSQSVSQINNNYRKVILNCVLVKQNLSILMARESGNMNGWDKGVKLADISEFTAKNCRIKDPENVERKINELIRGGANKLQIVSDFDFTITKHGEVNGRKVQSSFGIFNSCKSLPETYKVESIKLYNKYRPIEIDPHMPYEEKLKHMEDWWTKTGDILTGFELDPIEIEEAAGMFKDCLRDGTDDLFTSLNDLKVPILVFSAGLGDCVISLLKKSNVYLPNVMVISNFLQYKGKFLNGLQDRMIHVFNKNEHLIEGTEYYDKVHDRDHVIVMGDHLGDAKMADGVPSQSHVIKIGFLCDHIEDNLPNYMSTFDIVLVNDQTMNVPMKILSLIKDGPAGVTNGN